MADTAVAITAGLGTNVDTRTEATNGNHRQVIVIGDPSTNAGVAPVDATKGLAVDLTASGALPTVTAVTTVSTVTNLSQMGGAALAMGTGVRSAGTQRVTIATDDSVPVTIASVPSHAVTNAGTFVVQENGAAATSLALIDDTITAQGTALGSVKTSLQGGSVTTAAPTYTTGQISPLSLDTAGALRVTGAGGGTQYTEDVAAAADPIGNMLVAVRRDTLSASEVSADGDNIALKATSKGKVHAAAEVYLGDAAAATGSGAMGATTQRVALATDSPGVIATAALTAATAPAAAIATLAQYNATNPAPTDTQTVALQVGPNGAMLVQPYGNPANFVSGAITTAMTGTTSTSLVAAPAAGLRNYLTTIIVSNSHATVGTDIIIQDGSGGTTLLTIPAAAVYGGAVITLPTPLRQPTTATAIFCANVTTGASTKVSAVGYKGA